ncbi:DUF6950 family protein [Tardiphaga sp. 367_B4_N1_1]|uniref:DUF6950 family protein n=1 Tax=Tardiphaga sp. 367_B4_N1_1 TaxID=3240777 RepID=UPI003F2722E7
MKQVATRRFRLGVNDCGLWLADWCLAETGRDPAAELRGRYATAEQGSKLMGTASMPKAFGRAFRSACLRLTLDPVYGDICMIELGGNVCGAIRTRGFVVLSDGAGIGRVASARLVAAWSVHA